MSYTEADLTKMLQSNPDIRVEGDTTPQPMTKPVQHQPQRPKLSEHDLQAAIVAECDKRAILRPEYGLLLAIPNGQYRQGQRMEPGLRAGVPDLLLPCQRHGYAGLFIELKVSPNKPSEAQREWIRKLQMEGFYCKVVWDSVDETMCLIEWYLESNV